MCFGVCLTVGGELDIRLGRYDEKCNGDESLFSTPAAVTPGCWGK